MINQTVIIYDRGLYSYRAEEFAKVYSKVQYFIPESNTYPSSVKDDIATDLEGVERIYDLWSNIDKAGWIYFPDCYDGDFQNWLRNRGYIVFGEGLSGKLEMDKGFFYEKLEEAGMEVPYTFLAESLCEAMEYLEAKKDKWLKPASSFSRGDFETYHFVNMNQAIPWFNELKFKLGRRCDDLEILIQDPVDSECEVGYDGFCIDGKFTENAMCGYEIKDKGLIGKVFSEVPKIISDINDKMSPYLKDCRGHWSTELRIDRDKNVYFIDPTLRVPSPPGELFDIIYKNYPEACGKIANGEVPILKNRARYGAEIMLFSAWYEDHELCVEFPKEFKDNIKLKSHNKRGDCYYCTPNDNGGYFGGVAAVGDTIKEATERAIEIIGTIDAYQLEYDKGTFDKVQEQIKAGGKFGIIF